MALIKCKECGNEISNKAKECPSCGAPLPKKTSIVTWTFLFAVIVVILVVATSGKKTSKPDVFAGAKENALAHFKGSDEPTTKDAVWMSKTDFRVGVINDGTNKDGYARYVCSVLTDDFGLKGNNLHVGVYDIAKLANKKKWVRIGRHYCSDK